MLAAVRKARESGGSVDVAHGVGAFGYETAEAWLKDGFQPDVVWSDVYVVAIDGSGFDLSMPMSKLLNCGVSLAEVVGMSTKRRVLTIRARTLATLVFALLLICRCSSKYGPTTCLLISWASSRRVQRTSIPPSSISAGAKWKSPLGYSSRCLSSVILIIAAIFTEALF